MPRKTSVWDRAIKGSADPGRVRRFVELFAAARPETELEHCPEPHARVLAALFGGSEALSNLLLAHPKWLGGLTPEQIAFPRRKQGLAGELAASLGPLLKFRDYAAAFQTIRDFKQREMLRAGVRDLAGFATVPETILEISGIADVCLEGVWRVCELQMRDRSGTPFHQDAQGRWRETTACVLGMGKLGGEELNYSSDVDVLFVYAEEGGAFKEAPSKGQRPVTNNHQFFNRLAEAFIAEVSRVTAEGQLYRIDLRLRPEGNTGPLSRSLASYENYYSQWGQTWERMMLIKARRVAGDGGLESEFLEMIQPFRYPRSVNPNVLREIAAMKNRIENEVVRAGELDRNVKLGRGGIREVEFIAQALQLLHAGRQPFLQGAQTLPCLQKLVQYDLLPADDSRLLSDGYCFLRKLEHRLQMEGNLQTHTIPEGTEVRQRLAKLMGFAKLEDFRKALQVHTDAVRRVFERLFRADEPGGTREEAFPRQFEGAEDAWKTLLEKHGFRDPERACKVLREFVEGPGFVHVSRRTIDLAYQLIPRLFALCFAPGSRGDARVQGRGLAIPLSDPDRVVTRLDSFIAAYGARSTLFELWNSNPSIFELLLLLFDRSEFLAELAIRTPDLVDELVTGDRLRQRKGVEDTLRDLRHGLEDDDQHSWLRRYHQAELMRIGLRDILGLADFEQYMVELSALADACLQYALEVVMRRQRLSEPPFTIIGLGKLGGAEIDYGSDLDILFVADRKAKNLSKLAQYAVAVLDLVSKRTEEGMLFHTDARLRPDGEKGLLVNTLKAYEEYYRQRAQLWEIQSLSRSRPVAGDTKVGAQFAKMAAALANFKTPSLPLAAYTPDWRTKVHHMRMRIEKERTPAGKDDLAIKTGAGGLVDAEFVAQALCLENGWHEPNTLRGLEHAKAAFALLDADKLIVNYREIRRIEAILRRWSYEGETVLPDEPAPYRRVSIRCGFASPEAFRESMAVNRRAIREIYSRYFGPANIA